VLFAATHKTNYPLGPDLCVRLYVSVCEKSSVIIITKKKKILLKSSSKKKKGKGEEPK